MQGARQLTMTSHWTPATPPRRWRHCNFLIAAIRDSLVVKGRHLFCYGPWWSHLLECHGELGAIKTISSHSRHRGHGKNVGEKNPVVFSYFCTNFFLHDQVQPRIRVMHRHWEKPVKTVSKIAHFSASFHTTECWQGACSVHGCKQSIALYFKCQQFSNNHFT